MRHLIFIFATILVISCTKKEQEKKQHYTIPDIQLADGVIQRIDSFPSQYVKPRTVDVWLPSSYDAQKKYAVLYMHDGQMLFDANTTWNKQEWGVDEVMDSLAKSGRIKETIVVGIWNISEIRFSDYFPKKPFDAIPQQQRDSILTSIKEMGYSLDVIDSDDYLKFIVEEVKPYIDANYSTLSDAKNTAIMGSSMGGLISMYAISEYPEVFGAAACLSTHWIGTMSNVTSNPIPKAFLNYMEENLPTAETHKIYFDYGTETLDAYYLPFQEQFTALINQKGYQHNIKFEGHDHSEDSWRKRLYIPLEYLLIEK